MSRPASVAVLGLGAIGGQVAADLARGSVRDARLGAVVTRRTHPGSPYPHMRIEEAIESCDLIVECAGQQALADHGTAVIRAGRDLLITSAGALRDHALRARLDTGPGRWVLTSGAVGGLDALAAARRAAPFNHVSLTTTKHPDALQQPWMSPAETDQLMMLTAPTTVFHGTAHEAGAQFPASMNSAMSVQLVTACSNVQVTLRADPEATHTTHEVTASHPLGEFEFAVRNLPSGDHPSTSAIVPSAVVRTLELMVSPTGQVL